MRGVNAYITSVVKRCSSLLVGGSASGGGSVLSMTISSGSVRSGTVLGTRTVNGDGNGFDGAYGVTIDANGDVIVAGHIATVDEGTNAWVQKIRR